MADYGPTQSIPLSPNWGNYGPEHPVAELAETNPEAFAQLVNMPRDSRQDYRDSHWKRKHPYLSGVPYMSW